MEIGLIGLGNLGMPIAENLLEKGHALRVYNRTSAKAELLKQKGAIVCTSVRELALQCDMVFSIVSDDAALADITHGISGIAANLRADGIHACISTILPATAKELSQVHASYHNHYIAAPVMGRPEAARARKLNFLVSGEKSAVTKVKPFLEDAGGAGVWEFGDEVSAANIAKLCTNFMIVSAIEAMSEGINLAQKSGIDVQQWANMFMQTMFSSPVYVNYGNLLLKEAYQPAGFVLKLGLKDVNLILQHAETSRANMPLGELVKQHLETCVQQGFGDHDLIAIAHAVR